MSLPYDVNGGVVSLRHQEPTEQRCLLLPPVHTTTPHTFPIFFKRHPRLKLQQTHPEALRQKEKLRRTGPK